MRSHDDLLQDLSCHLGSFWAIIKMYWWKRGGLLGGEEEDNWGMQALSTGRNASGSHPPHPEMPFDYDISWVLAPPPQSIDRVGEVEEEFSRKDPEASCLLSQTKCPEITIWGGTSLTGQVASSREALHRFRGSAPQQGSGTSMYNRIVQVSLDCGSRQGNYKRENVLIWEMGKSVLGSFSHSCMSVICRCHLYIWP